MNDSYKEVHFFEYCKSCKHKDLKEHEDPCHECLSNPTNLYSHMPTKWEEKDNEKKIKNN